MERIFFTSDQHFFHESIIRHANRPYASVPEMNQAMIDNFNSVVTNKDRTYHLGDLMWLNDPIKVIELLKKLKGKHNLLKGNHDKWWKRLTTGTYKIPSTVKFEEPLIEIGCEGRRIIMCHYALAIWRGNHRGNWHLHGHSHGNYKGGKGLILDVGVDTHNYFPWSYDQVKAYMEQRKIEALDHHVPEESEL